MDDVLNRTISIFPVFSSPSFRQNILERTSSSSIYSALHSSRDIIQRNTAEERERTLVYKLRSSFYCRRNHEENKCTGRDKQFLASIPSLSTGKRFFFFFFNRILEEGFIIVAPFYTTILYISRSNGVFGKFELLLKLWRNFSRG